MLATIESLPPQRAQASICTPTPRCAGVTAARSDQSREQFAVAALHARHHAVVGAQPIEFILGRKVDHNEQTTHRVSAAFARNLPTASAGTAAHNGT